MGDQERVAAAKRVWGSLMVRWWGATQKLSLDKQEVITARSVRARL